MAAAGEIPAEVSAGLASILEHAPDDLTANIASILLTFREDKRRPIEASIGRLFALIDRHPLETLPSSSGRSAVRPNSRQRSEAARRLGLWLVARECWTRPGMKALGDRFAGLAFEAARRNPEKQWTEAMLREWGQVEYDLGDRVQAERRWAGLLEMILARTDTTSILGRPEAVTATPREPFDKAIVLAKMLAERSLTSLSIRAIRKAFRGGSPLGTQLGIDSANLAIGGQPQAFNMNQQVNRLVRTGSMNIGWSDNSGESPTASITMRIAELERLWTLEGVEPRLIYEVLRDVVLPAGRPDQVDLYPLGMGLATAGQPRSVGHLLATLAVAGG